MMQHEAYGLMLHRFLPYPSGKSEAGVKRSAGFLDLRNEHLQCSSSRIPETKRTAAEVCFCFIPHGVTNPKGFAH